MAVYSRSSRLLPLLRWCLPQSAPIDVNTWVFGEWTGTLQAGVAFIIAINAKEVEKYMLGENAS